LPGLRLSSLFAGESLSEQFRNLIIQSTPALDHLYLQMVDSGAELSGVFQYRADLFERETIQQMIAHFERLLEIVIADPTVRLGEIGLLTRDERQTMVYGWNETQEEVGPHRCVHERFEARVDAKPEAIAVKVSQGMRVEGEEAELS